MISNNVRSIVSTEAIAQSEIDDAQEIASLFTSNTRQHLEAVRNLRNDFIPAPESPLTQRLSFKFNLNNR